MSKLSEYGILYVDDELMALKYFEKGFSQDFTVLTASSAAEGWAILQQHHTKVGILLSDQRMPGETGVQLLERARHTYPQIIRILVTAYSDVESAIAGVNAGAIYKYISKPWDVPDLRVTLLRALQFFELLKERDQLLGEKLSILQQIVLSDRTKNLGVLAAGLQSHFRNALLAAAEFVRAVPQAPLEPLAQGAGQTAVGKTIESLIFQSSRHLSQIASAMSEMAEGPPDFAAEPSPLSLLLGPLDRHPSLPTSSAISLNIDPALPPLRANQKQILRLFTNLISNLLGVAEKQTPIHIEARVTREAHGAEMIQILLSDESPAWTPEQMFRLFAPFSSAKKDAGSMGLDLAVCYFIAHHHGGRLEVSGKQDSKISIYLPVQPLQSPGARLEQGLLDQLFHYERTFDDFFTRSK